jgi:hypothetical protein
MRPEQPTGNGEGIRHVYELLYAYRFGTINFLELLEQMEAILCSSPSRHPRRDTSLEEAEMPDGDGQVKR